MIVKFTGTYKSLKEFTSDELPKFTVITGENGSGKSQLISIMKDHFDHGQLEDNELEIIPRFRNTRIEGIENSGSTSSNYSNWTNQVQPLVRDFMSIGVESIKLIMLTEKLGVRFNELSKDLIEGLNDNENRQKLIFQVTRALDELPKYGYGNYSLSDLMSFHNEDSPLNRKVRAINLGLFLSKYHKVELESVRESWFYTTPAPDHYYDVQHLFNSYLRTTFYNYALRRHQNRQLLFFRSVDKKENSSISDDEFDKLYPPPWDLFNQILEKHNIDFYFRGVDKEDFTPEMTIEFPFIKKSLEEKVSMNDLSSGEKVIVGLISKLFISNIYHETLSFPDLVVLDEPDAHLHPNMSKILVEVLDKTFAQELGIQVIITTHSPSTVALCPEGSVFQLKNGPNTTLGKIHKDDALKILTSNIPTLSIDYENHKQIFVESPTDTYYYRHLYDKIASELESKRRLYFISAGYGKGNCNQVVSIVNDLQEHGNNSVFGLIDWDRTNEDSEYIKVHGLDNRYSIENYCYDPVYIVVHLMTLKAHGVHKSIGFSETYNEFSIGNEPPEVLQGIVDWFFNVYCTTFPCDTSWIKKEEVLYHNGVKLMLPKGFLVMKGHDLEIKIKKLFSVLDRKYTSEGDLQKALTITIAKCYPFIPEDTFQTLSKLV